MYQQKGITLISLIITIIIIMILAGITINLTIGENGIFKLAKKSKTDYETSVNKEEQKIELLEELLYSETQLEGEIPEDAVARIKMEYYTSLQNAIDAVPTDNTQTIIYLLKDTSENINIGYNKNVVLNLSDKKITNLSSENPVIELEGNLTLKDGSITGNFTQKVATIKVMQDSNLDIIGTQIDRKSETDYSWETIEMRGNLNILSGKIYNDISNAIWIYSDSSIINIKGGTIETENATAIGNHGTLIIEGGTITTKNAHSIRNYGTLQISGTANISNNCINGDNYPTIYNQSTGNVTIEGGTITSTGATTIYNKAKGQISITGGSIITGDRSSIYNEPEGQISMTGGTITTGNSNSVNNHGILKIGGTANISNNSDNYPTIFNQSTGNVTIEEGTITSSTDGIPIYNKSEGQISITGGTITSENDNSIHNYGILKISGTANISNNSNNSSTIYNRSTGNVTIEGGTITSGNSNSVINYGILKISDTANISNNSADSPTIYNNSTGNITIEGGTITSGDVGSIYNEPEGQIRMTGGTITTGNGNSINNGGILKISGTVNISNNSDKYPTIYNASEGNVTIEGGTITNIGTYYAVCNDGGTVNVTGGSISSKNF